jgi:hypothetical protein
VITVKAPGSTEIGGEEGGFLEPTFHYQLFKKYSAASGSTVVKVLHYKSEGSIPDGVMEFFIDINPSDRTMALGSTQLLTEMSTRCISWG